MDDLGEHLARMPRWLAGSFGGVAAAITKYLGQHHATVLDLFVADKHAAVINYGLGYAVSTPLLMALGALVALFSTDKNRARLFVMGIAAPALVTTISGGKAAQVVADLLPVSSAYAQSPVPENPESVSIAQGLRLWFNLTEPKYRVVVGSFKNKTEAALRAEVINKSAPDLGAFVGQKMPNNDFYPVIVGGFVPVSEALRIKERVLKSNLAQDAFLSNYPHR